MLAELNGKNNDAALVTYTWGPDLSGTFGGAGGVGGLLGISKKTVPTVNLACLYDGNGNITQLVDMATGDAKAQYEYDPFGNLIKSEGVSGLESWNKFRFSTKQIEEELLIPTTSSSAGVSPDLYYYGYRYYSPRLGRWINRDPIGEKGGVNLNLFCFNSPIFEFDVAGAFVWKDGKRQGGSRAIMIAEEGDDIQSAADFSKMDISEVEKWLKNESTGDWVAEGDAIQSGCEYSVPNTYYVIKGDVSGYRWKKDWFSSGNFWISIRVIPIFKSQKKEEGYKITQISRGTFNFFKEALENPDTFGIFWAGHGAAGVLWDVDDEGVTSFDLHPFLDHKLGELVLFVCYAGCDQGWQKFVSSPNGSFHGSEAPVWPWLANPNELPSPPRVME
jgi:RHS repeat-associated protein